MLLTIYLAIVFCAAISLMLLSSVAFIRNLIQEIITWNA